ncbi:MAG TPA: hypothetical protein VJV79_07785 [Polyangiaceae bacterium]|nr:hypothetical protein [Polyangiaceae bacterium]
MDRKRNSEKPEPEEHPIEPEMPKGIDQEKSSRTPATEPPKEKRRDDL